jgi:ferredoxin--NADP+ reductase
MAAGRVSWEGWQTIDAHEQRLGAPAGRPRIKLVRVPQMLAIALTGAAPDNMI